MPGLNPISWDKIGERLYETGVDHVVIYGQDESGMYTNGEAWNGVTNITENKSGAEPTPLYADNIKYLVLKSLEEYGITVECYTYPRLFEKCNGMAELTPGAMIGQQTRASFGMSFRTLVGNDIKHEDYGYKLHLVYGCDASPSEESNATINDSPEAKTMSFEITTTAVDVDDGSGEFRPTSCVTINSVDFADNKEALTKLEDILYGRTASPHDYPYLPLPSELKQILTSGKKIASEAVSVPAQNTQVSEVSKSISEFITPETTINWSGIRGTAIGEVKKIESGMSALYSEDGPGHYFPVSVDHSYDNKKLKVEGMKSKDEITMDTSGLLIIKTENCDVGKTVKLTTVEEKDNTCVMVLDLSKLKEKDD